MIMEISGEQLLYLIRVLKESLDLPIGYDYPFTYKKTQREIFHEKLMATLLSQKEIEVQKLDLMGLQELE